MSCFTVSSVSKVCGGRGLLAALLQSQVTSNRGAAHDSKFLTNPNVSNLKRGRGGRSSFSGTVVTLFGTTGFMGPHVLYALCKEGHQVILPHRIEPKDMINFKLAGDLGQIQFRQFDQLTEETIRKAVKYSDVVINLISSDYETWNYSYNDANIIFPERIARVCKEAGTKRFIHFSALNSDREHIGYMKAGGSAFLRTKGIGEKRVKEAFPEAIIFRPSNIFGSEDRFLSYWASRSRLTLGQQLSVPNAGLGIFKQPVYCRNVAEGVANAIAIPEAVGKTYEIVGPRRYELADFLDYMIQVLWRDHRKYDCNRWDLKYHPFYKVWWTLLERYKSTQRGNWCDYSARVYADTIERETVSDITTGLPTLVDLGVKLTNVEDMIDYFVRANRAFGYYTPLAGEIEPAKPPKYVQALPA